MASDIPSSPVDPIVRESNDVAKATKDELKQISGVFEKPRGRPRFLRTPRFLRILGPGLITGAADDDPSGIGTYSQAGAAYGPLLLWSILYMLPLMICVQEMCGRIGLVTRQGLAGVIRDHYSRKLLYGAVALLFIANTINVGADLGAMAAATNLLIPWAPIVPLLIFMSIGVLLLEVFVPYKIYAQVLKYLALSLLAYIVTGVIVGGDIRTLLVDTLLPHIKWTPDYLTLVVAVVGTTISPYLFFWQASEEVEEEEALNQASEKIDPERSRVALHLKAKRLRLDTVLGMVASEVTAWFIIETTAATLHVHNVTNIQTAAQAAQALEPFVHSLPHAGFIARTIFALGIVGTGLLAVPVLAGSAAYGVAEALGWHEGLSKIVTQARGFYAVIAASTLVGLALNFVGINPITALVYAAIINAIVAVPLLWLILRVANNRTILGEFVNGRLSNVVGVITLIFMAVGAIIAIVTLLPL